MNKQRRKWAYEIADKIREVSDEVMRLSEEEREAMENLPENMEESDRYQAMEDTVASVECVAMELGEQAEYLIEACD